jgi:hypothetical protein
VKNCKQVFALILLGYGLVNPGGMVRGQTVERDTTITGPRGRTIQRQVEVQRGPGTIDRSVQIKRPGGTIDRQVQVQRSPVMRRGFVPGPWGRPPWIGPRPLVIAQPAPALGLVAAPFMNFSFGGGGFGGGMGGGFGGGPGGGFGGGMGGGMPGGPGGQPAPPPDQVALMCHQLQGFSISGRKEAAYTLGRLSDPRAVPSLVHVLKHDNFKDVRVAAAIALGEIGGSDAAVALERAAVYDHRDDVKKAASTALERLNAKAKAAAMLPRPPASQPLAAQPSPPATSTYSPFREVPESSGTASEAGDTAPESSSPARELTPPPPPTPVPSGSSAGGNP